MTGKPRVIDGDTIHIGSNKIRLWGFDAPERKQTCMVRGKAWNCGFEATEHLKNFIGNNLVKCVQKDIDRYKRIVAKCAVGSLDIGAEMVEVGLAVPYWKYSGNYYIQSYKEARGLGRGIHTGTFVEPWEWRRGKRLSSPSANTNQECKIKGNVSRSGEQIYHVPTGQYYERTIINKNKGERFFCSVDDAEKAGWRKSKR